MKEKPEARPARTSGEPDVLGLATCGARERPHYSVPARYVRRRLSARLGARSIEVLDGTRVVARHERAIGRHVEVLTLDHYLEVLRIRPGALPGATALAQAKAAGAFTASHQRYWEAALAARRRRRREPSARDRRDEELVTLMVAAREQQKFRRRYGPRKMWLYLRGQGHDVARCTIERLYRREGWVGATRKRRFRTTIADPAAARPVDLVDRQFFAHRPNQSYRRRQRPRLDIGTTTARPRRRT